MNIYLVTAYRWGNRENHSYLVSVRSTVQDALKDAETEEGFRGIKYVCEVIAWELDQIEGVGGYQGKTIKPLPERTVQQMMTDLDRSAIQAPENCSE